MVDVPDGKRDAALIAGRFDPRHEREVDVHNNRPG
jgi:hypothetical protein